MNIKLIKTEKDYEIALSRIDQIMDAKLGTPEADELELLAALVEMYEETHYPIDMPDPVDAIKFRMEQLNLNQQALVPSIGSKSKVSEVLNKKRPLSLSMMRALHTNLGIPSDILLQEQDQNFPEEVPEIDWANFPIHEMMRIGWIPTRVDPKGNEEEIIRSYIEEVGGMNRFSQLFFRKSRSLFRNTRMDRYALMAWCLRVMELSKKHPVEREYKPGLIDLLELSKLSYFNNGPLLAKEYLEKHGIQFFIVPHLKKTFLDGAVMIIKGETPVIALTLRYDRIDNFWFCLLHEIAHLIKHLSSDVTVIIIDDIKPQKFGTRSKDTKEKEADIMAQDALIPKEYWEKVNIEAKNLSKEVDLLSEQLKVHPAIIAGRIRFEKNNYRILSQFVRNGEVSKIFKSSSN